MRLFDFRCLFGCRTDGFSQVLPTLLTLLLGLLVLGLAALALHRLRRAWRRAAAPAATAEALYLDKRTDWGQGLVHLPSHGTMHAGTRPRYFATFQLVETGDRVELSLPEGAYRQLNPGDRGLLTFGGGKYLNFVRQ